MNEPAQSADAAPDNTPADSAPAQTEAQSNVEHIRTLRDALPLDLRDDPSLKDFSDVGALAKAYRDTKAMVGSSVRIPTDDAGQEAIDAFISKLTDSPHLGLMRRPDPENAEAMQAVYQALGVPEDVADYERPEGVDAEAFGALANVAKEVGLTKAQYAQMAAAQAKLQGEMISKMEAKRNEDVKQLQGEWGLAFGERVSRAADVVRALGGHPALEEALANNSADAATLRLFDTIGQQLGKEGTELAAQVGKVTQQTPDELRQRRAELINRQITENLTPTQREDLQQKVIKISEQLVALGG